MSPARFGRLAAVIVLLSAGLFWIHQTSIEPARVSLYVTALIGGITTVYALLTYEILLQNQAMARATERSLRFSYAQNLLYQTVNTKDPRFRSRLDLTPIDNQDYRRAIAELSDEQQAEFVFAVVKNVGRGSATNLKIEAQYSITDNSSVSKEYSVTKNATVQILEPNRAVALSIFFSKVPTRDDQVRLVSAKMTTSNFYLDALYEPDEEIQIDASVHQVDCEQSCVVRLL